MLVPTIYPAFLNLVNNVIEFSIIPERTQIKDLYKKEMTSYKGQLLSMATSDEVEAFVKKVSKQ